MVSGVVDILGALGPCAGGAAIYKAAKVAMRVRYPLRQRRRLSPQTISRLQHLYPNLILSNVTFVTSISHPGNWFQSAEDFGAITLGYTMYFTKTRRQVEETDDGLRDLMHELVHVDQLRRRGNSEEAFGCDYGIGYVSADYDYRTNPLEIEAYDFVANHPMPPPTTWTSFCFYDRNAGEGEIYATDGSGGVRRLFRHTTWRRTWNAIIPGLFDQGSWEDLLFYDRDAGEGEFYATDGVGGIDFRSQHATWRRSWDMIVPGNFGGNGWTDLLFYDRAAGEGAFHATDGRGGVRLISGFPNWRGTWDQIVPGEFGGGGGTDLLFYDRDAGEGVFYATDGVGGMHRLSQHTTWRNSWDMIVPGNFGGDGEWTDLLFYDRDAGEGEFYATDGVGGMHRLSQHTTWRKSWDVIVSGVMSDPSS